MIPPLACYTARAARASNFTGDSGVMTKSINTVLQNIVFRLLFYYSAVALAFTGAFRAFPQISTYVNSERLRGEGVSLDLDPNQLVNAAEQKLNTVAHTILDPYSSVPVLVALFSVIALTVPVAWVYRWTRNPAGYSASIANALLVLPLAITLVVFLVKGSLALAFSLAGIVAAVRFRTALSESEDAVYVFVVIGIGLAAGVQLANVAFIASVFFNASALLVWHLNFGARPAVLNGWSCVPYESPKIAPEDAAAAIDQTDRARYNTRLRLPTTDAEATQKASMPILDVVAKSWRFAEISKDERGMPVVEFDVRLRKSVDVAALVRDLEDAAIETGRIELKRITRDKPARDLLAPAREATEKPTTLLGVEPTSSIGEPDPFALADGPPVDRLLKKANKAKKDKKKRETQEARSHHSHHHNHKLED